MVSRSVITSLGSTDANPRKHNFGSSPGSKVRFRAMPLIFLHDANSTRVEDERWPPWSEVEAELKFLPGRWRSFGSRHNEERNESAGSSSSEMLRGEATSTLKTHDEKRGDEWSWLTYEDALTLKSHEEKRAEDAGSSSSKMLRGEARSTLRTHDERRDDEWTWLTYENSSTVKSQERKQGEGGG